MKKIIGLILTAVLLLSTAITSYAVVDYLDEAIDAVKAKKDTITVYNDMSEDDFKAAVQALIPEEYNITLDYDYTSNFKVYNATTEKDGSVSANFLFTQKTGEKYDFTRHYLVRIVIPKAGVDVDAAVVLEEDVNNVLSALDVMNMSNMTGYITVREVAQAACKNGTVLGWKDGAVDIEKATTEKAGYFKGTLRAVNGVAETDIDVRLTIPQLCSCNDVSKNDYFAEAVEWALQRNITTGTSATHFSPHDTCTRAQILTFLWRAVKPPVSTIENPFTDVSGSHYYYYPAMWAYEKGMVSGNAFSADTPCTRASTVMYLWKNAGSPDVDAVGTFIDVPKNADYAKAVAWAVQNGITAGTSANTFSPDDTCTRGQIVTFLQRAVK
ncbi:MAG: S-layer homology domain-containing protein [Clostridia bacterium]|nr:S-layer homology domain-containing protein [Clostridia bacterium]